MAINYVAYNVRFSLILDSAHIWSSCKSFHWRHSMITATFGKQENYEEHCGLSNLDCTVEPSYEVIKSSR